MNENKFLKDFFTKKYADSIGESNFYIAFEDCGFHISKESFTDELTKQYSKNVQVEQLSNDCNYVVPICDTIMGHSSSTISDCIELLKDSISFNDKKFADNAETLLPLFGNAKNKLTSQFQTTQSTSDGRNNFYQSNLNPDNFLDDTDTSLWTPYNESWSFPSTTTDPGQPTPEKAGASIWKIRPELFQNLQVINKIEIPPQPVPPETTVEFHPELIEAVGAKKMRVRRPVTMMSAKVAATIIEPTMTVTAAQPGKVLANTRFNSFMKANTFLSDSPALAGTGNQFSKRMVGANLLNRDIMLQRLMVSNEIGKKEDAPVKTSNVNISFQYCIVNILRPWLYKNIFDISNTWYCAGLAEGFFSTGETTDNNKGKLPSLPVSMILIKDLSISATFNAGDWENAKNAVALDSLNIAEADFKDLGDNKHMIESKGVQIIGWICEYLQKFPICSDPSLLNT
jgi:hypothetical protein